MNYYKKHSFAFFALFLILVSCDPKPETVEVTSPPIQKPRTIVTTDGEIDDVDSYIRMLLYANEFQIEGLIYSSSMWHYKGDGNGTLFTSEMEMTKNMYGAKTDLRWPGVEWMNPLLDAYEEVYPKLNQHAEGFPTADYLRSVVRVGNIDFEGEMEVDTEGSDFIKAKLLDENREPIYLQAWGGTNTIARALKSIEDEYKGTPEWEGVYQKVIDKAIIYAILDQDATYRKYVEPNWPDLKIFYNSSQFWCFAYAWQNAVPESQHFLFEGEFMGDEIINNHGPLLKQYYSYGDGQHQEGDDEHIHGDPTKLENAQWGTFGVYDFISEGDSPAYLHLIDVGLDNLNHPEWGGWGGRLEQSADQLNRWEDGGDVLDYNPFTDKMDATYPQIRWVEAIQQDFAARADWCVMDYADANHSPEITAITPSRMTAKPGETFTIEINATDPDGDQLETKFWIYKEVGTYAGEATLSADGMKATVNLDANSIGQLHVIAEVKDNGVHPMTRYQRFVVEVR
ncbi:nucleoside hydrolase-like domain-containing protein [Algoriphagus sp.]|uniref:nucleoside hydrolase-like domain-containing protein n=1 Tax=Algoriphagus sp. TaxID=1872435 RepID=UPI0025FC5102|nr:nucleoside hydrolase-like domain-containing protein [Algoriphagus sp.]